MLHIMIHHAPSVGIFIQIGTFMQAKLDSQPGSAVLIPAGSLQRRQMAVQCVGRHPAPFTEKKTACRETIRTLDANRWTLRTQQQQTLP